MGKVIRMRAGGAVTGSDVIEQAAGQELFEDVDIFRHMYALHIYCIAAETPPASNCHRKAPIVEINDIHARQRRGRCVGCIS